MTAPFYNEKCAGTNNEHACYRIIGTRSLSVWEVFDTCAHPFLSNLLIYAFDKVQVLAGAQARIFFSSSLPVLPSVSCMHRLSCPVLKFAISSFSLEEIVPRCECIPKTAWMPCKHRFFSLAHSHQLRSCKGILKSSKTYSLLGQVLFIFASSVLNERNGRGLLCFMLTCFDLRAQLKCNVLSNCSKSRHFDAFTKLHCFPHWLVGWCNPLLNLNITKSHLGQDNVILRRMRFYTGT